MGIVKGKRHISEVEMKRREVPKNTEQIGCLQGNKGTALSGQSGSSGMDVGMGDA